MTDRWLLTGGAGFLGTHLALGLVRDGIRPTLLDREPPEEPALDQTAEFIRADVRDARAVEAAVAESTIVVHAAAALPFCPPGMIRSVSVEGTRNVLRAAHAHGIRRVIHVSSAAVFGLPRELPLCEDSPFEPLGPYGRSKLEAERVCVEFRERGLDLTILRPVPILGPGRLGAFAILFDWIHGGKRIPILGTGRNRMQMIEVTDLVDAVRRAAAIERPAGDYNLGAVEFGTVREDLTALCAHAATGARLRPLSPTVARWALRGLARLGLSPLHEGIYEAADRDVFVESSRARDRLGWMPAFSNARMLSATYDWYRTVGRAQAQRLGKTHRRGLAQRALRLLRALS